MATKTKNSSTKRYAIALRQDVYDLLTKAVGMEMIEGRSSSRDKLANEMLMQHMQENCPRLFK